MLAECVTYREQLIVFSGLAVVLAQMLIYWAERRHFRRLLNQYRKEGEADIHSIDRN